MQDGDNLNNYIDVVGDVSDPATNEARARLLSDEGKLRDQERSQLKELLSRDD